MEQQIVVYKPSERVRMEVKMDGETVWLTQEQMCLLFGRERSVITKHIRNVFKEGELEEKEVCAKFAHTTLHGAIEGKTQTREVLYYNLDMVISVGYRVKSVAGVRFRQWATRVLREMLLNRLDEIRRIGKLEKRVDTIEQDVKQIKGGVTYLIEQISAPQEPPRRRIGFGATEEDRPEKPYGKR
ncbi:MAG: virulence RhuM family protein [Bacteroidales bacterium]|nr:virulence RhuM family protein [Bacteroidales bacterium]